MNQKKIAGAYVEIGCRKQGAGKVLAARFGRTESEVSKVKKGCRGTVSEPTYSEIRLAMLREFGGYLVPTA